MTAPTAAPTTPPAVVDSAQRSDRIDDHRGGGERAVPYHCPFCAEEDLRPHGTTHGAWHCRTCLRVFSVRFLGLADTKASDAGPTPWLPVAPPRPPRLPGNDAGSPIRTTPGGSR